MSKVPSTNRILEGVRIIAFTNGYAGPYCGRLLAQYGAEVIKVESIGGGLDSFRHFGSGTDINASPRFLESNLGVRSLTVNLKHPVGLRLIKELAKRSDAVYDNYRPQVLERLGLGEEEIRKVNPGIVILKMPGLGQNGPKSWYGTWGLTLTAFCGMTYLWNHPGQPRPIGSQGVYPDHVGFILAPTLMVAALLRRRLTGEGVSIDMAQVEATVRDRTPRLLSRKRGIPSLPVKTPSEFMADPHIQEREFFATVTHPILGEYRQAGAPFIVNGKRVPQAAAPTLGQHNSEVYNRELGLDNRRLEVLAENGIL